MLPAQTEKNCTQCGAIYSDDIDVCSADGAALVPKYLLELVGTLFDGRYRILSLLGYGSAGAVYKAEHEILRQLVAIKLLHSQQLSNQSQRLRFEREGKALSALSHINIVSAHDYGVTPEFYPYLVMQLPRGFNKFWHRTIFQGSQPPSIVAADRLYRHVRIGSRLGCSD